MKIPSLKKDESRDVAPVRCGARLPGVACGSLSRATGTDPCTGSAPGLDTRAWCGPFRVLARVAGGAILFVLTGCATMTPPVIRGLTAHEEDLPASLCRQRVLLVRPQGSFARAENGATLSAADCGAEALMNALPVVAQQELAARGIAASVPDDAVVERQPQLRAALGALDASQPRVFRNTVDAAGLLPSLHTLAEQTGAKAALLQKVHAEWGASSGWDPMTGTLWQGRSSTSVAVILLSLETGEILWGREAFVRSRPSDKRCVETVRKLYADNPNNRKGVAP